MGSDEFGIAFVLTDNDPFFCLDLDDCLNKPGALKPAFFDLVDLFKDSAIEISQSKRGLHVWGKYTDVPTHKSVYAGKGIRAELYTGKRFICLTGRIWLNGTGTVSHDATEALKTAIHTYFSNTTDDSETATSGWTTQPHPEWSGYTDDDELIDAAIRSRSKKNIFAGKCSFSDLWHARVDALAREFPPQKSMDFFNASSADAALAQHLAFWTGADCARMERLIRASGLLRDKWDTRDDYLPRTILNACARQKEFHNKKLAQKPNTVIEQDPSLCPRDTYLDTEGVRAKFKEYVYILDTNQVLTPNGQLIAPEQFRNWNGNCSYPLDNNNAQRTSNAWKAFIESQCFSPIKVESTCFFPKFGFRDVIIVNDQRSINLWKPPNVRRIKGDAFLFYDLLDRMYPSKSDQAIILAYFAACVQYPGEKFTWAMFLQGTEGGGKSQLLKFLAHAVGSRYVHQTRAHELGNRFNDWLYGTLLILVEDINVANNPEVWEVMKTMITSATQEIEPKHGKKLTKNVCCNLVFTSNHKNGVPKTDSGRRYAPFFAAQQCPKDLVWSGMDGAYFDRLARFMDEDGMAIVAEELHTYRIPDHLNPALGLRRAPITTSTQEAIAESRNPAEQDAAEAIAEGLIGFRGGWVSTFALGELLAKKGYNRISQNRKNEMLVSLGYVKHPHLKDGRPDNPIAPDGGKPRLYCTVDHPTLGLESRVAICENYTAAQKI